MSETPKFTPGPWQWWTSNSWRRLTAHNKLGGQYEREGNVLCPVVARDGHPDLNVTDADMALIAAAPELYDVLQRFVTPAIRDALGRHHKSDCPCNYCAAIAALAKAEGRK